ncbi:MAG: FAD-dependent oxidoreductase, partial [Bdellovibrionales bacterium]|nr:FAD-dependent oxidoreductase [Bdellovibrionales bacterium]
DVLVYGATPSGIMAAVSAALEGMRTTLVYPGQHVGGMVSGGLSNTDVGKKETIGGQTLNFFRTLKIRNPDYPAWVFEPKEAEKEFRRLLADYRINLLPNSQLVSVEKSGAEITSISTTRDQQLTASVFIDASYESDLVALSGVSFTVGREPRSKYSETIAGFRGIEAGSHPDKHAFRVPVSAASRSGGLLPGVVPYEGQAEGSGDAKVPAYTFRLCLTLNPTNSASLPPPSRYDPQRYELLGRYLEARPQTELAEIISLTPIPGDKFSLNARGPFSTDFIGGSWDYPNASPQQRQEIWNAHRDYILGFFHFLKRDPRVPESIASAVSRYALCRDEFINNENWPPQLYVRVARRMLGDNVMTEQDVYSDRTKETSIGMGSRPIELRHVQRLALADGSVMNEGHLTVFVKPYQIPYWSILPRRAESTNLLVPVGLSASYVAYNSLRMEPVYMILGESAGVAAALAVKMHVSVQDVPYAKLRAGLEDREQVLALP